MTHTLTPEALRKIREALHDAHTELYGYSDAGWSNKASHICDQIKDAIAAIALLNASTGEKPDVDWQKETWRKDYRKPEQPDEAPPDAYLKEAAFNHALDKCMPNWEDGHFIDGGNILAVVSTAIDYYKQRSPVRDDELAMTMAEDVIWKGGYQAGYEAGCAETGAACTKAALATMRESGSASLEKCAAAIKDMYLIGNSPEQLAKAVLGAAGVKYE